MAVQSEIPSTQTHSKVGLNENVFVGRNLLECVGVRYVMLTDSVPRRMRISKAPGNSPMGGG